MQDPKETFNNIEQNTEMALLQSEKIAESVDNLEPIMEGVLVKADDILNEQKKTNELLSKEEEPKPEVQKIELLGAELITIKGKDGENGDKGEKGDKGDTGERGEKGEQGERGDIGKQGEKGEKGDNGDTGKDGIDGLDGKDGKNGKNGKDGSPDTPKQVKEKLLKVGLDYNELDNTPDINKAINIAVAGVKQSSKTVSLVELDDIDYSGLSIVDGKYVLGGGTGGATWGSITGNIVDQADLQNALNAKQDSLGFTPENVANKSTSVSTDGTSDTKYPSVKAIKDYADSLVAGLLDYRGGYDASVNTFPTSGGSGTAGAISKGDMFIISIAGTLGGTAVQVGDSLIASVDTPAQTASNWNILNSNITYVPEDVANKDTDVTLSLNSDTKYPTQKAVKTYVDLRELSSNKSTATTLGASDILYPTQKAVKTYIDNSVSTETENAQSGTSYTFALTDGGKMVTGSNSSPTTFTVPTNSSIGFPIGTRIDVLQIGTGKITIANSVGVTLLSQGGNKTIKEQYVACTLWKKDTDLWYLMGNLQA